MNKNFILFFFAVAKIMPPLEQMYATFFRDNNLTDL